MRRESSREICEMPGWKKSDLDNVLSGHLGMGQALIWDSLRASFNFEPCPNGKNGKTCEPWSDHSLTSRGIR